MTDTFALEDGDNDPHDLTRFTHAQDDVIDAALAELRAGRKRSHWMWFVFPQLRGLGRSEMAYRYGIADLAEARAYLRHPVLSARLREAATALLLLNEAPPARDIFGSPDDLKLRSSMTLFELADQASPPPTVFAEVLRRFFSDMRDDMTLQLLAGQDQPP